MRMGMPTFKIFEKEGENLMGQSGFVAAQEDNSY